MGCFTSFLKYILFTLNFIFWIAGCAFLGIGIWFQVDKSISNIVTIADVSVYVGSISFIILGSVMFVIAFCGCCGAMKENRCLLGTYFTFVLLIFLAQVGIAIWGFVEHSSIENAIKKSLNGSIPINSTNQDEFEATKALQSAFKCCGYLNGCQDWPSGNATGCSCSSPNNDTCKVYDSKECTNADNPGKAMYTKDCYDSIVNFITDNIVIFAAVAVGIAVTEIFLMIFAMIVCNSAGKNNYTTV